MTPIPSSSPASLLESFVQVGFRNQKCREQPRQDACDDRHSSCEDENPVIKGDALDEQLVTEAQCIGSHRSKETHAPVSQEKTCGTANETEQHTLHRQLAHQASPTRAQRRSNGDLSSSRNRTSQLQIHNVGAGDEKDEPHCNQQDQKCRANLADQLPVKRFDSHLHFSST